MDYQDTHMTELDDEQFFSTSDKIFKLSDTLAEEIILENIREQLESNFKLGDKINYVSLFREKYGSLTGEEDFYDKDYVIESLTKVVTLVAEGLKEKYEVEIGTDLDFASPDEYLKDMETLYEFLFIRNCENLINYFDYMIEKNKESILEKYRELGQKEENAKDLFVVQSKKKFKNEDDIIILHFMDEIITDLAEEVISGYVLFDTIVKLDLFEEFNNRMDELLINYGNKIVLNNDAETAKLYLKPLEDAYTRNDIRSKVWADYLENCELIDD